MNTITYYKYNVILILILFYIDEPTTLFRVFVSLQIPRGRMRRSKTLCGLRRVAVREM
jgi:hypothetical protein